jgi:CRP-like cAMP-binding protein
MNLKGMRGDFAALSELSEVSLRFLESVSAPVEFGIDDIIFEEDSVADTFHVIVAGKVALELHSTGHVPIVLQTLRDGDLVGVSWLIPPYRWSWRARAQAPTSTVAFDAAAVRAHMGDDCEMERGLLRMVLRATASRLQSTRTQLIDLYGGRG